MAKMRYVLEQRLNQKEIKNKHIYFWGTGNTMSLAREGLERIKNEFTIEGYVDTYKSGEKRLFWGGAAEPIITPEELFKKDNTCVVIVSQQPKVVKEISRDLEAHKIEYYNIDEFIFTLHKKDVLDVYDMLDDERSKETYAHLVICRMDSNFPEDTYKTDNNYFAIRPFLMPEKKEVFVDCGAYVGDSVEQYIWNREGLFEKIIAFEPNLANYNALKQRKLRLCKEWGIPNEAIDIKPFGVGNIEGNFSFSKTGVSINGIVSDETERENAVPIVCLDSFIDENISFIKADIESYEYKMLMGAEKCILKNTPLLAICIYHSAVDFFSIALLIRSICPDYKFAVRHHTFGFEDTILYAYVEK